ncbi:Gfo/Idh/MocA family protein [Rhodobium gokarnense]|uniref:Dehydrogenase n=1 Tax=Rhodobium gokarnense TaxID=364296 RepID=A0ABT3HEZ3_9HYPH|nr:Gfo/Idh/MocA family oxidoreductase [Rhodobium gokarnense]MCW2308899.1 putative dehydrogenase [Rhodobium gokarnense]
MTQGKIRVGIIGLKPGSSWAGVAHVPSLQALADDFVIAGVANSTLDSSKAAAAAIGIPNAFASADDLIASPEIDAVTVTITVPQHLAVVKAALEAGKHVYCEAPLGNGLEEAEEMAALARDKGLVAVVGLQARVAPEVFHLRKLLDDGYVGRVLSSSLSGWGGNWGQTTSNVARLGYLLDAANGATMLTIPLGHTLAALRDVLGDVTEVSALLDTRVSEVRSEDDGSMLAMTAPDQILVTARMESGTPLAIHYQGGMPNGTEGFVWDIHGTEGDIRITAPFGHGQMAKLSLAGAKTGAGALSPIEVPDACAEGLTADPVPGNVARNYARMARDIRTGSHSASTFEDGVGIQRLIDAIEESSRSGARVTLTPSNRALPLPE